MISIMMMMTMIMMMSSINIVFLRARQDVLYFTRISPEFGQNVDSEHLNKRGIAATQPSQQASKREGPGDLAPFAGNVDTILYYTIL